jgi:hypothetical protein
MPAIAFIDEEAGGLQHFKDFVWEIGLVLRTYDYKWNLEERKEFQWNPLPVGINLEAFAQGFLAAKGIHEPDYSGVDGFANAAPPLFREKSEFFSAAMGVEPPDPKEHHQALPDARWVERWWDFMGMQPPVDTVAGFRGLAAGEK